MLEATIDAGYKVAMPPSLKAALAHKLGGKDQFHFRSITEDELLEVRTRIMHHRTRTHTHHRTRSFVRPV
jgi:hypothetical protein